MRKLCLAAFWIYTILAIMSLLAPVAVVALAPWGVEQDPLVGLFAVALAQPWLSLADRFVPVPDGLAGWITVLLSLAMNAALLRVASSVAGRAETRPQVQEPDV